VAAGQKTDQDAIDHLLLADDDFANLLAHQFQMSGGNLKGGVSTHVYILLLLYGIAAGQTWSYYSTRETCRQTVPWMSLCSGG
jgi:hypothetical protein